MGDKTDSRKPTKDASGAAPSAQPHRVGRFKVEIGPQDEAPLNTLAPTRRVVFSA